MQTDPKILTSGILKFSTELCFQPLHFCKRCKIVLFCYAIFFFGALKASAKIQKNQTFSILAVLR